jgi:hypothetical protein
LAVRLVFKDQAVFVGRIEGYEHQLSENIYIVPEVTRHQVEEPFVSRDAVEVGLGEVNALKFRYVTDPLRRGDCRRR